MTHESPEAVKQTRQLPLRRLLSLAATARKQMKGGSSFSAALDAAAEGLPSHARAALQSILYDLMRNLALTGALSRKLLNNPPPPPVQNILEAALALLITKRYNEFTLVSEAVNAIRADKRTQRFSGLVNAVLRRFLRESNGLLKDLNKIPEVRFNAPSWWIEKIRAAHPQEWEKILLLQRQHAVAQRQGFLQPVLAQDDRCAELAADARHGVQKIGGRNGVELGCRLVEQQHARLQRHDGGQIQKLLLSP